MFVGFVRYSEDCRSATLRTNNVVFKRRRSCVHQAFVVKRNVSKYLGKGSDLHVAFKDFEKA